MEDEKITVIMDGEEVECEVYFSLICNENNKAYIGYTDHTLDEDGKENVYVSSYDPHDEKKVLNEINTPEEWDLVNTMIEKIKKLG